MDKGTRAVNGLISQSSGTSKRVTSRLPLGRTARFSSHPVTLYTTLGEGKVSAVVRDVVRKRQILRVLRECIMCVFNLVLRTILLEECNSHSGKSARVSSYTIFNH
jgi:hypothetical protein